MKIEPLSNSDLQVRGCFHLAVVVLLLRQDFLKMQVNNIKKAQSFGLGGLKNLNSINIPFQIVIVFKAVKITLTLSGPGFFEHPQTEGGLN